LPKYAERVRADTAFDAEDQAIIGQGQIIDLIEIGDERIAVPADLEQLGPVFGVAGEPGGLEAQDDADRAERDFGRPVRTSSIGSTYRSTPGIAAGSSYSKRTGASSESSMSGRTAWRT
jgi:hypothetical protein